MMLFVSSLSTFFVSNIERCANYLDENTVYVKNIALNDRNNELLTNDKDLKRVYQINKISGDGHYFLTFENKNDIEPYNRRVFLNDNFDGVVISVPSKKDVDMDLIGTEILVRDLKKEMKVPIVNFCYNDEPFAFFGHFYNKKTTISYYINDSIIRENKIEILETDDLVLEYNHKIDSKIDNKIRIITKPNPRYEIPDTYLSNYTLVNCNIDSTTPIIDFLNVFSYLYLGFSIIILCFIFSSESSMKKEEIKIRESLGASKQTMYNYLIIGDLCRLFIYILISSIIYITLLSIASAFIINFNLNMIVFPIIIALVLVLVSSIISITISIIQTKNIKFNV